MSTHLVTGYGGIEHVTAADDGSKNAGIVGIESYVLNTGNKFEAEVISSNLIRIKDGDAIQKGRHWNVAKNDYVECNIDNGLQGLKRNDLIVARYSKNPDTGIESEEIAVIKGTSSENPADPEYETGDIYNGDLADEMPLYRVELDGLNIVSVKPLFKEISSLSELMDKLGSMKVDDILSSTSKNPVQNKVVNEKLQSLTPVQIYKSVTLTVPYNGETVSKEVDVPNDVKSKNLVLVISSCAVPALSDVDQTTSALFTLMCSGIGNSSPLGGTTNQASAMCCIGSNTKTVQISGRIVAKSANYGTQDAGQAAWKAQTKDITVGMRFIGI